MKKVVIIVLVVLAALMITITVLRPGGDSQSTKPNGLVKLIGRLAPSVRVKASDVAGNPCWNGGVLNLAGGQECQTVLPEKANKLRICAAQGAFAQLRIKGVKYGPQDADKNSIGCPDGQTFSLYDDHSVLIAVCAPQQACRLQLL